MSHWFINFVAMSLWAFPSYFKCCDMENLEWLQTSTCCIFSRVLKNVINILINQYITTKHRGVNDLNSKCKDAKNLYIRVLSLCETTVPAFDKSIYTWMWKDKFRANIAIKHKVSYFSYCCYCCFSCCDGDGLEPVNCVHVINGCFIGIIS